jgi:hypothetical protein
VLVVQKKDYGEVLVLTAGASAVMTRLLVDGQPAWVRGLLLRNGVVKAQALMKLDRHREALVELERASRWTANDSERKQFAELRQQCLWLMTAHALTLARAGRHVQATALVQGLPARTDLADPLRLQLARIHAQAAAAASARLARQYLAVALEQLQRLLANGWFDDRQHVREVQDDADLEPLRAWPEYRPLRGKFESRISKSETNTKTRKKQ